MRRFLAILVALVFLLAATQANAGMTTQATRWRAAKVDPRRSIELDKAVTLYRRLELRYRRIQEMRPNGVPAMVLFCLHQRESSGSFTRHPHEGSPLAHRTRDVPKGRIPAPAQPPFTFEASAEDAYYVVDRLDLKDWTTASGAMDAIESFNGLGYRRKGIPSPYLWAGTSIYLRGKYVADGRFDPTAVDKQLGAAAILIRMRERGVVLPFSDR